MPPLNFNFSFQLSVFQPSDFRCAASSEALATAISITIPQNIGANCAVMSIAIFRYLLDIPRSKGNAKHLS